MSFTIPENFFREDARCPNCGEKLLYFQAHATADFWIPNRGEPDYFPVGKKILLGCPSCDDNTRAIDEILKNRQ